MNRNNVNVILTKEELQEQRSLSILIMKTGISATKLFLQKTIL